MAEVEVVPEPVRGDVSTSWSLAMIVRNEEATLEGVLSDAAILCEQMVVVDTGSTDRTVDIARACGAEVYSFEWVDNFAAARNYSFDQCRGDWIMWLDADDRVPLEAQEGFRRLKEKLGSDVDVDGVMVPYRLGFSDAQPHRHTFSFDRERVLRRAAQLSWSGPVHEVITLGHGRSVRYPDAWVEHRPGPGDMTKKVDRNLKILEAAVAGGDRSARTLFYYGNELRDHRRWEEALCSYQEYLLASQATWEKYSAMLSMADCALALGRHDQHLGHLTQAILLDSSRAEAFGRLGVVYFERQDWWRALPLFAAAAAARRPSEGFVDGAFYDGLACDYLSVCLSRVGRHREAMEQVVRAFPLSGDRGRLMSNFNFDADCIARQGQTDLP